MIKSITVAFACLFLSIISADTKAIRTAPDAPDRHGAEPQFYYPAGLMGSPRTLISNPRQKPTGAPARAARVHAPAGPFHAASDPRPAKWCGFWMRQQVWRDPGREFNKAILWARYGSPAPGPAPGVIGVQRHHVFKVVEVIDRGTVLAVSGNDRNAVRTRPRSIKGVIAWRI